MLVYVFVLYLVSLLHKLQLCWHPLRPRSLVYKGLNGSLAECKANGYWWLLTHSGLRWSNFLLFPLSPYRELCLSRVCLWAWRPLDQAYVESTHNKWLQDCYCAEAHLAPISAGVWTNINKNLCAASFHCVNLPCKNSKYLEQHCIQIEKSTPFRSVSLHVCCVLVCIKGNIFMYGDFFKILLSSVRKETLLRKRTCTRCSVEPGYYKLLTLKCTSF